MFTVNSNSYYETLPALLAANCPEYQDMFNLQLEFKLQALLLTSSPSISVSSSSSSAATAAVAFSGHESDDDNADDEDRRFSTFAGDFSSDTDFDDSSYVHRRNK